MATRRSWFTFTQVSNLKRKRQLSFVLSGKNPRIEFTELTCLMCPFLKQLLLSFFKRMESTTPITGGRVSSSHSLKEREDVSSRKINMLLSEERGNGRWMLGSKI